MKVDFNRGVLAETLNFIKTAIPRKDIEPILNSFYFKGIGENKVQIVATDYDLMSVAQCDAKEISDVLEFTIPADKLLQLITKLTDETISFVIEDSSIYITCGTYKATFKTLGCDDYPEVYHITNNEPILEFDREAVLSGFKHIDFAVNSDEAKKNLMAVQVSKDGMVASNGSVTALYRENFDVDTFCISSNCLSDLISVMTLSKEDKMKVFSEDAYLVFKFGENIFFTRKTNVTFPDVFNKIDKPTEQKNKETLKFNVKELKSVLDRVSLTAPAETRTVKFEALSDTEMKISAKDSKDFSSEESISYVAENFNTEEPIVIYFNYTLLLDILGKLTSDDVVLKMDYEVLRMPVRIDEDNTTIFLMRSAM